MPAFDSDVDVLAHASATRWFAVGDDVVCDIAY